MGPPSKMEVEMVEVTIVDGVARMFGDCMEPGCTHVRSEEGTDEDGWCYMTTSNYNFTVSDDFAFSALFDAGMYTPYLFCPDHKQRIHEV